MITTLEDFVRTEYPNHDLTREGSTSRLAANTAVGEFRSRDLAAGTTAHLRDTFGADKVVVVVAAPPSATVVRHGDEDSNSMANVPKRRPLVGAIGLGIVVLVIAAIVALIVGASPAVIVICAVFAAILGAIEGAIIFGGARFAGEKAWNQQNLPDQEIEVAAVLAISEEEALEACKLLSAAGAASVRIVGESGAWHLPNLFTASD